MLVLGSVIFVFEMMLNFYRLLEFVFFRWVEAWNYHYVFGCSGAVRSNLPLDNWWCICSLKIFIFSFYWNWSQLMVRLGGLGPGGLDSDSNPQTTKPYYWLKSPSYWRIPNTWFSEVFGPQKTYHPNTEPQEVFGRLGLLNNSTCLPSRWFKLWPFDMFEFLVEGHLTFWSLSWLSSFTPLSTAVSCSSKRW